MSATQNYFIGGKEFGLFAPPIGSIIAALNAGLSGVGSVTIKAGPRGLSIAFEGKVVAKLEAEKREVQS